MYGLGKMGGLEWGGLLADLVTVPHADAMLVKLPAGVLTGGHVSALSDSARR